MTQVTYPQIAELAKTLVSQAKINATPNDLALAGLVHQMLEGIATGKLVVGTPVSEAPPAPAVAEAVRDAVEDVRRAEPAEPLPERPFPESYNRKRPAA